MKSGSPIRETLVGYTGKPQVYVRPATKYDITFLVLRFFYRQQSAKTLCFGDEVRTWFTHDNLTFALPCFQNPKLWPESQCSAFLFLWLLIKLHDLKDVNLNSAELPCAYHKGSQFDFSQPNQKVKVSTTVGKLLELSGRTTDPNLFSQAS